MFFRNNETDFWKCCRHYLKRAKYVIKYYDNKENTNYRINEATLKSFETVTRLARLDVIYRLSQIYNMKIDDLIGYK